jgi:UDP-glucose:(heptosyl)LPS alpha-1,3-glucosyltransferase
MRPLRVALLRQHYSPFGGAEGYLERLSRSLQSEGLQVTLLTRAWRARVPFQVVTCDPFYLGRIWRDVGFASRVSRELDSRRFDLVQSHERIPCCDVYRAGDGVHREWLIHRRSAMGLTGRAQSRLSPYDEFVMWQEKRVFRSPRVRAVVCNSSMVRSDIIGHYGVSEDKLHVIYPGVDASYFEPALKARYRASVRSTCSIPQDALLLLFVGSGFERKGLWVLLEAIAALREPFHLIVVGHDSRLQSYESRAARLGIGARVHFANGQQDVRPFYGAADAFVLPSLYDPFGAAVQEAMAVGLPVVTSTKTGAAELVRHGKSGFVCDPLDQAALVAALRHLRSPELRERMGAAARKRIEPMTLSAMSKRFLDLYEMLIGTSSPDRKLTWRRIQASS